MGVRVARQQPLILFLLNHLQILDNFPLSPDPSSQEAVPLLPDPLPPLELVHLFDKMCAVKAFVFDVDGVLTDNSIQITEAGELLRTMDVRDGQAIKWALKAGLPIGVITGGRSAGVTKRLAELGLDQIYSGVAEKAVPFAQFLERYSLIAPEVCYIGDDLPDLPVLRKVGFACCPADAVPEILEVVDYVSPFRGGQGCVREVIEKVLKLQHKWPEY